MEPGAAYGRGHGSRPRPGLAFGAVHLLCNNAGVGVVRTVWENTLADWEWVLGVNLWGVIHGVHVLPPIMLAQDTDCHIVNTSSIAGLVVAPGSSSTYNVSKHGIVALTETIYYELAQREAKVKTSVLCPLWADTRIVDAERNRPQELRNDPATLPADLAAEAVIQAACAAAQQGMAPDQTAAIVFDPAAEPDHVHMIDLGEARPIEQLIAGFRASVKAAIGR